MRSGTLYRRNDQGTFVSRCKNKYGDWNIIAIEGNLARSDHGVSFLLALFSFSFFISFLVSIYLTPFLSCHASCSYVSYFLVSIPFFYSGFNQLMPALFLSFFFSPQSCYPFHFLDWVSRIFIPKKHQHTNKNKSEGRTFHRRNKK